LPPVFAGAGSFWSCAMASVLQMSVAISMSAKRFFMGYSLWGVGLLEKGNKKILILESILLSYRDFLGI